MNVSHIFSAGRAPETPEQVQELLKNIIVITNYLPGVRSSLGWRGIFRLLYDDECWTFRTAQYDGVFAFKYTSSNAEGLDLRSLFDLYYFPDPEEEVIEKFPINGALFAYRDNYREMIRSFPEHPEFFNYFFIGKLSLGFNPVTHSVSLGIESVSEDIIISEDGIKVDNNGQQDFLVSPGEPEQAIPSYELSSAVFDLLVSSFSFHLDRKPAVLSFRQYPAEKRFIKDSIIRSEKESDGVTLNSIDALFSETDSQTAADFNLKGKTVEEISEIIWQDGDSGLPDIFSGFSFMNTGEIALNNSLNRNLLGIETKPPLYIVSGFLGSGKTSFIKNFLEFQSQKYLFGAVIQNELGETGLDGTLISDECRVVEMDEGCVCCSLSGNLRKGINSVISEFVPDFIILETTGAANPMNLVSEIHDLRDLVKFDSVTTIVDAINIEDTLKSYDIAKDQLKAADIIVLNKTENMTSERIRDIETLITSINKRGIITAAEFGRVNPALLYDSEIDNVNGSFLKSGLFPVNHKTHSDDKIDNHTIKFSDIPDRNNFLNKIDNLPFDIFRIKGVLKFEEDERPSLFQYVSGRYEISQHAADNADSFLVFIGKSIDTEKLTEYFL